jgi:hypothetical protein
MENAQRKPPTPAEVQDRLNKQHGAIVPVGKTSTAVAVPDNQSAATAYLNEIAPSSVVGERIDFNKNGKFVRADTDEEISEETDFVVLADQTMVGWIKFNGPGNPPDQIMGALYDGFVMPRRADLGDNDEAAWPEGLSGRPDDPWKHQIYLVLQQAGTTELFTFVTRSVTGRRSVGNLLKHYDRMCRVNPGEYPVVRLKTGGFQHRDERVGWVATPAFAVVGRAPRDSVAQPGTSAGGDMDDVIPF